MDIVKTGIGIKKTIKNVTRFREILSVFAKHGFDEFILKTKLHNLIPNFVIPKSHIKKSEDFEKTLKLFIEQKFRPEISTQCKELQIPKCWPLKGEWNNARFSAFLTYQKNQNLFENIKVQKNLSVKALLSYIVEEYKQYNDKDLDRSFQDYLELK